MTKNKTQNANCKLLRKLLEYDVDVDFFNNMFDYLIRWDHIPGRDYNGAIGIEHITLKEAVVPRDNMNHKSVGQRLAKALDLDSSKFYDIKFIMGQRPSETDDDYLVGYIARILLIMTEVQD